VAYDQGIQSVDGFDDFVPDQIGQSQPLLWETRKEGVADTSTAPTNAE
jgi:hypothetical protein